MGLVVITALASGSHCSNVRTFCRVRILKPPHASTYCTYLHEVDPLVDRGGGEGRVDDVGQGEEGRDEEGDPAGDGLQGGDGEGGPAHHHEEGGREVVVEEVGGGLAAQEELRGNVLHVYAFCAAFGR